MSQQRATGACAALPEFVTASRGCPHSNAKRGISRRSGWAGAALALLLAGCGTTPEEPASDPTAEPAGEQPAARTGTESRTQRSEERSRVQPAQDAPKRYVVKKGDTLWDISAMFLEDPWLWPEIWHVNPQIANPHLIYPGDVITLFWVDGKPHMRIERDGEIYQTTLPVDDVNPRVRYKDLDQAIHTIPVDAIRPFLERPRVVMEDELDDAAYLLRSADGRLLSSASDKVYVRGIDRDEGRRYSIVEKGEAYVDPETGDVMGYETIHVGDVRILEYGDPATARIVSSEREAQAGNRLLPYNTSEIDKGLVPRPPEEDIEGQIMAVVGGVSQIGQYMIVALNRGTQDGVEPGHVFAVFQKGEMVEDEYSDTILDENVRLPDQRAGTAIVFRTFNKVSYALIMQATDAIHVGDMVRKP